MILKSVADLARFPFTMKSDLRENYPFGLFAVPQSQVNRIHASSGTTGQPTVVGYTKADLAMWDVVMDAVFARLWLAPWRSAAQCLWLWLIYRWSGRARWR